MVRRKPRGFINLFDDYLAPKLMEELTASGSDLGGA